MKSTLETIKYFAQASILVVSSIGLLSCTKIAVDGQDYDVSIITNEQSKSVFREFQDIPNNTQAAISLIENGVVTFYGIKRENDTILTVVNHNSVFEVGSISKVFTATLLADLVLEGNVQLNDQVSAYWDIPFNDTTGFTLQQLANHTSGLPRMPSNFSLFKIDLKNPYKDYDEVKLKEFMETKMELEDQGDFSYSNLGAAILGCTLAKTTASTYENLIQSRIFSKHQMSSSTTNRDLVSDALVPGLNRKGKVTPNWDLNIFSGAGGVLSSANDLSKFALAQFDNSNKTYTLTRVSTYNGYQNGAAMGVGLGWMIKHNSDKQRFWHNGATGGYVAFLQLDIENKNAVIILTNISGFSSKRKNVDSLGNRLMDSLESKTG